MSIKYSDSGFLDGADSTKKLSFDVSGVTTGTTRTITMPDANVDLSSVGTPDDNSVTLAKMAGGTDGNLITYDASGDPAYVTTGTSGQVLTSGGTGVAPTFQTAAAGGADTSLSNLTATGENKVAQAWVNFNGTGTVAIRDSYNVSSITDNVTGNYTINFTNSIATNSCPVGSARSPSWYIVTVSPFIAGTTSCGVWCTGNGDNLFDPTQVAVAFFGD